MFILETDRTLLRPFKIEDGPSLFELNLDPEVLKYTGDIPFNTLDDANRFVKKYIQTQLQGLGRWAVIHKDNSNFLGWCGLKYTLELDEYDIGFRFFKTYWNKGFATEVSKACLDYGFRTLKLDAIVGRAMKQNGSSIRVLEKIGMRYAKTIKLNGDDWQVYKIERSS